MFAFIVTEPVAQPVPLQPAKTDPAAGMAFKVTMTPLLTVVEQVVPQLIPTGELVTVPLPVPALLSMSVKVEGVELPDCFTAVT
jgi:hypothetical protein